MKTIKFELKKEHITLLNNCYISWNNCEFGAPGLDCKRPYGNSIPEYDIADILGWPIFDDEPLTEDQEVEARHLHQELQTALQVVLDTKSFEPGTYEKEIYGNKWRRVLDLDNGLVGGFSFNDYERVALSTAVYPKGIMGLMYVALKLAGEAGEVVEKFGKQIRDNNSNFEDPEFVESIKKELGDVLWYIANLSNELGFKMEDVAKTNNEKLLSRKERGVLKGSGDDR